MRKDRAHIVLLSALEHARQAVLKSADNFTNPEFSLEENNKAQTAIKHLAATMLSFWREKNIQRGS